MTGSAVFKVWLRNLVLAIAVTSPVFCQATGTEEAWNVVLIDDNTKLPLKSGVDVKFTVTPTKENKDQKKGKNPKSDKGTSYNGKTDKGGFVVFSPPAHAITLAVGYLVTVEASGYRQLNRRQLNEDMRVPRERSDNRRAYFKISLQPAVTSPPERTDHLVLFQACAPNSETNCDLLKGVRVEIHSQDNYFPHGSPKELTRTDGTLSVSLKVGDAIYAVSSGYEKSLPVTIGDEELKSSEPITLTLVKKRLATKARFLKKRQERDSLEPIESEEVNVMINGIPKRPPLTTNNDGIVDLPLYYHDAVSASVKDAAYQERKLEQEDAPDGTITFVLNQGGSGGESFGSFSVDLNRAAGPSKLLDFARPIATFLLLIAVGSWALFHSRWGNIQELDSSPITGVLNNLKISVRDFRDRVNQPAEDASQVKEKSKGEASTQALQRTAIQTNLPEHDGPEVTQSTVLSIPIPLSLVEEYNQVRDLVGTERSTAAVKFAELFDPQEMSLSNLNDVLADPMVRPLFKPSSRGNFLLIVDKQQSQLFPAFNENLEGDIIPSVFEYRGLSNFRLTRPATLYSRGDYHELNNKGLIESGV